MTYDKLIQNIDELSSKKGVNRTTALTQSGVGKNFVYNINKGSAPSSEKIQQLADYFDVSTDYLLGKTDNPKVSKAEFAQETLEFMERFEQLPDDKKKALLSFLDAFTN